MVSRNRLDYTDGAAVKAIVAEVVRLHGYSVDRLTDSERHALYVACFEAQPGGRGAVRKAVGEAFLEMASAGGWVTDWWP
jgi:hypothetical protein